MNGRKKIIPHLIVISTIYFVLATFYAIEVPDWQSPDEPAHYNYIQQLAETGVIPILQTGDYNANFLLSARASKFDPSKLELPLSTIRYENWQPPTYYLLLTPVYLLSEGSLLALRMSSVAIGFGVILLAYFITLKLYPSKSEIALCVALFASLLPQHLAIVSSVNNDVLSELLAAIVIFLLVHWIIIFKEGGDTQNLRTPLSIGIFLGIGFITKGTTYTFVIPVAIICMLINKSKPRQLLKSFLQIFVPATLIGSLWWVRNCFVYGWPDFLGKSAHDLVITGQRQTLEVIETYGFWRTLKHIAFTTYRSFIGQFGWMEVQLPQWVYIFFTGIFLMAIGGVLFKNRLSQTGAESLSSDRYNNYLLTSWFLSAFALFAIYNLQYLQPQGRYLFTALIPIGIFIAIGLNVWQNFILKFIPTKKYYCLSGLSLLLCAFLVCLNFYLLYFGIILHLSFNPPDLAHTS